MNNAIPQPPVSIDGAAVMCYLILSEQQQWTGRCSHYVSEPVGSPAALAICQYENDGGFYLFTCDALWRTCFDTFHDTQAEAKAQAEFEYAGSISAWVDVFAGG